MKCKSEKKLFGVITASVLTLVLFIGMSISLTTYGAEQIDYVERSWDGTQVVDATTKRGDDWYEYTTTYMFHLQ